MTQTGALKMASFLSETAVVNGIRLHYWLGGNPHGKPVLLWHGFLAPPIAGTRLCLFSRTQAIRF